MFGLSPKALYWHLSFNLCREYQAHRKLWTGLLDQARIKLCEQPGLPDVVWVWSPAVSAVLMERRVHRGLQFGPRAQYYWKSVSSCCSFVLSTGQVLFRMFRCCPRCAGSLLNVFAGWLQPALERILDFAALFLNHCQCLQDWIGFVSSRQTSGLCSSELCARLAIVSLLTYDRYTSTIGRLRSCKQQVVNSKNDSADGSSPPTGRLCSACILEEKTNTSASVGLLKIRDTNQH